MKYTFSFFLKLWTPLLLFCSFPLLHGADGDEKQYAQHRLEEEKKGASGPRLQLTPKIHYVHYPLPSYNRSVHCNWKNELPYITAADSHQKPSLMGIREVMGCNEQYHMILPQKTADLLCARETRLVIIATDLLSQQLYYYWNHTICSQVRAICTRLNIATLTDNHLKKAILCLYKEALQNGPITLLQQLNPQFHNLWKATYHAISTAFYNGSFFFNSRGPSSDPIRLVDFYNNPRNQRLMYTDFSETFTPLIHGIVNRVIHSPDFPGKEYSEAEEKSLNADVERFLTKFTQHLDILAENEQPSTPKASSFAYPGLPARQAPADRSSYAASAGAVRVYLPPSAPHKPSAPPPPPPPPSSLISQFTQLPAGALSHLSPQDLIAVYEAMGGNASDPL